MPLNNPHHRAPEIDRDPLTDSGIHRTLGTRVRLHVAGADPIEVGLLELSGVTAWWQISMRVREQMPIEVEGRMSFAAGVVQWVERIES